MLSIKKGDILIKVSGLVGEPDARPIKSSLVFAGDVFPCTCAPHHALVYRESKPPLCVDLTAGNLLVLPPDRANLPLILGGKK